MILLSIYAIGILLFITIGNAYGLSHVMDDDDYFAHVFIYSTIWPLIIMIAVVAAAIAAIRYLFKK